MKQLILKLTFITTIYASLSSNVHAQNCKYVKDYVDPFSKKLTKTCQMAIGAAIAGREVLMQKSEGKYYLGLRITFSDMPDIPFKKGDKISFKLANDDLVEVSPEKDVPASPIKMLDVALLQWLVMQEVSAATFEKIATSPITAIKFTLKQEHLLPEIKERQTIKIKETAACMMTL